MVVKCSSYNIIFQANITQGLPSNPSLIAPRMQKLFFKINKNAFKLGRDHSC